MESFWLEDLINTINYVWKKNILGNMFSSSAKLFNLLPTDQMNTHHSHSASGCINYSAFFRFLILSCNVILRALYALLSGQQKNTQKCVELPTEPVWNNKTENHHIFFKPMRWTAIYDQELFIVCVCGCVNLYVSVFCSI